MKKFLSLILLFAFLLPQLTKVGIFISFKANQDFIAKVLCINKEEPEMKCNGKCHLAKELNKTESKDQNSPITVNIKTETTLFLEARKTFHFSEIIQLTEKKSFVEIKQHYNYFFIDGVFHPPQVFTI